MDNDGQTAFSYGLYKKKKLEFWITVLLNNLKASRNNNLDLVNLLINNFANTSIILKNNQTALIQGMFCLLNKANNLAN